MKNITKYYKERIFLFCTHNVRDQTNKFVARKCLFNCCNRVVGRRSKIPRTRIYARENEERNRQRPITLSLLIFESLARDYRMRENHGEWWLVFLIRTEGSRSLLFRETIAETANNHYLVTNSTRIPAIIIRAFLFEPSSYVNQ